MVEMDQYIKDTLAEAAKGLLIFTFIPIVLVIVIILGILGCVSEWMRNY